MTVAEFLAWESRQELRYDFDGCEPVAMTGGTIAHDLITFNLQASSMRACPARPCRPHGPNVKIATAAGNVRYPDALVTVRAVRSECAVHRDSPVAVFEVVSEDTARTDRVDKLREYQATPSDPALRDPRAEEHRRSGLHPPGR